MAKWDVFRVAAHQQAFELDSTVVRRLIARGMLGPDDCIRKAGRKTWHKLASVKGAMDVGPADLDDAPLPEIFWLGGGGAEADEQAHVRPVDKEGWAEVESMRVTHQQDVPGGTLEPTDHEPEAPLEPEEEEEYVWQRRSLEVDEFDLTPMVDMTFLLNMFFIMTTSYALLRSIPLPAPTPTAAGKGASAAMLTVEDVRDHSIVVAVRADDSVAVDDEKVDVERLAGVLQDLMRNTGRSEVIVKPEGEAHHEAVVRVFDAAQEAGLSRIQLAVPESRGTD